MALHKETRETPDFGRKKNKYAQLTVDERKVYIQKSIDARKRRNEVKRLVPEVENQNVDSANNHSKNRRNRYGQLTGKQRQQYIQDVTDARNKRKMDQINSSDKSKKKKTQWLLKAQLNPYEHEGQTLYDPICSELHELHNMSCCVYFGAKKFQYEPPTFCCDKGKIQLASADVPAELYSLFSSNSEEAKEFRKHIRGYNSIFAFTSFGVNLDKDLASAKRGVFTFRAQGQIYHHLPGLIVGENCPCYFQFYFYDTNNEVQNRTKVIDDAHLSEVIVKQIIKILERNPYAQFLRRLKGRPSLNEFHTHIRKDIKLDQRVYNSPMADQVAAIWIEGNNPHIPLERDIVVHPHSGHKHRVRHYFGSYDPLQYPHLFPNGETGWHQNIEKLNPESDHVMTKNNNSIMRTFTSA